MEQIRKKNKNKYTFRDAKSAFKSSKWHLRGNSETASNMRGE